MSRLVPSESPPHVAPLRSEPPSADALERRSGGFLRDFMPHLLANVLAMVGIALSVLWVTQSDREEEMARFDALQGEVRELRQERDRLSELTHALASEAHETDVEARLVRARLEQTEARLGEARFQGLDSGAQVPEGGRSPRVKPPVSKMVVLNTPEVVSLASAAPPSSSAPSSSLSSSFFGSVVGTAPESATLSPAPMSPAPMSPALMSPAPSTLGVGAFDLSDFEPGIPRLNPERSQLDRDRAMVAWRQVMIEAAAAECTTWRGADGRCESDVRSHLWPFGREAVDCILSGNAIPDYVAHIRPESTPTHSIPLQHGAVILCDGALDNP